MRDHSVPDRPEMVIRDWQHAEIDGTPTISARIDHFDLKFSGQALQDAPCRGDAFLAVALLPAMARGEDLNLTDLPPVSSPLLESLDLIQELWTTWNDQLSPIRIRCNVTEPEPAGAGSATFFSGGIDGLHAVLAGGAPDERLIFINGFDFDSPPEIFAAAVERVTRLSRKLDRRLDTIETNWIRFTRHHRLARLTTFGSFLSAVGHLLASGRVTIASGQTWDSLYPTGSHPLLDPLWSNGVTTIRHFGADSNRAEKTTAIAGHPELLEELWVCHEQMDRNCGLCDKCIRTRAMLRLVSAEDGPFPSGLPDPLTAYLRIAHRGMERAFLPEMIALATEKGLADFRKGLEAAERRLIRRQVFRELAGILPLERFRGGGDSSRDLRPWGNGPLPMHS